MTRPALAYAALMICLLAPVWAYAFVTQDGPAHLYTAEIIRNELAGNEHRAFELRGQPMPNMLGHLLLALFSTVATPAVADKLVITLTCVGVGVAALILRRAVRGRDRLIHAVPLAAFISVNRLWLLGFYSFLIGVILFGVTVALAWRWKEEWSVPRGTAIGALLIAGYFAHPVSLGATMLALGLIALATSRRSLALLAAASLPAAGLMLYYVVQASSHSPLRPEWRLGPAFNPRLLSIANTGVNALPIAPNSPLLGIVTPLVLFAAALVVLLMNGLWTEKKVFAIVAGALLGFAILGPANLGSEHGDFLRQRLMLLGCVAAAPLIEFNKRRLFSAVLSAAAVVLQAGYLMGYAQHSDSVVAEMLEASPAIPTSAAVLPLVIKDDTRFRATPELHAPNLLGIGNDRILWSNYEAELYYFPVKYKKPLAQCPDDDLPKYDELVIPSFNRKNAWTTRRFVCAALINQPRVDVLLTRGVRPELLIPWLGPAYELQPPSGDGTVSLWKKRTAQPVLASAVP